MACEISALSGKNDRKGDNSGKSVPYGNSARELVTSQEQLLYSLQNLQYELMKTDNETTQALEEIKCRIASAHMKSSRPKVPASVNYKSKSPTTSRRQSLEVVRTPRGMSTMNFSSILDCSNSSVDYRSSTSFSDCTSSVCSERLDTDSEEDQPVVVLKPRRKKPLTILR
ncbi:hypothetical protein SNE40_004814 [Patella caerulea]|uniref:Uncharacterized protein n=1 Tax=Patella caerulea TaxID=87958 RepID=A0AAN8K3T3_PATCE